MRGWWSGSSGELSKNRTRAATTTNCKCLVVVTVSDATCSECGAPVADEKVEEVIAPTLPGLVASGRWFLVG